MDNKDFIISAGIKHEIARRCGFQEDKIILLEGMEEDGFPTVVYFDVVGQGYAWNIEDDEFHLAPAYGRVLFGDAVV